MSTAKVALTFLIILITALLWAAAAAPAQPTQALAMRRESQPLHYLAALDQSLAHGISTVNWKKVTWPQL